MINIKMLDKFTLDDQKMFGKNGYTTNMKYTISKEENYDEMTIRIRLDKLQKPYERIWPCIQDDFDRYEKIIAQGFSLGAYDGDKLIGVVITEKRKWNNSLWIDDIEVAEDYRGTRVGTLLLSRLHEIASMTGFRIIALEVQNTNYPAIKFYHNNGYELEGIDLSLYTNTDPIDGEVALFMKKKLV